jgi:hypothetical protein
LLKLGNDLTLFPFYLILMSALSLLTLLQPQPALPLHYKQTDYSFPPSQKYVKFDYLNGS